MKPKKVLTCVLCLLLTAVLLVPTASAAAASAWGPDLSRPGSVHNKTFTTADIAEYFLDDELCQAERDYLIAFAEGGIIYNDGITTRNIAASFDAESGELSISAYEFEYTASDGALIAWIPTRATLGEESRELVCESGAYVTVFEGLPAEPDAQSVGVTYSLELVLDAASLEQLLQKAYNDAPNVKYELERLQAEYEEQLYYYGEYRREYEEYLELMTKYTADYEAYAEYVVEKAAYDERLAEYTAYMSDVAAYKAQKAAYEKYLSDLEQYTADVAAYKEYEAARAEYLVKKSEYDTYYATARLCATQMSAIDLAKVNMTLGRTAYDAINSTLVDEVIAEKETISSSAVGVSPDVVDLAGASTERLRILLDDYFALETDAAKYAYYSSNYTELCKHFRNLFVSLDHLYKNDLVRSQAVSREKDEKYRILVAQLYLISQALIDGDLLSIEASYTSAGSGSENKNYTQFVYTDETFVMDVYKYDVYDILGETKYIDDTDSAAPITGGYPTAVECPTEPPYVEAPVEPTRVDEPVEVDYTVEYPGEPPAFVENPGEPPAEVLEPVEPEEYIPDPTKVALVEAFDNGYLLERTVSFDADPTLRIEKTVQKRFIDAEEVTVYFIGTDGQTVIFSTTADKGSSVDFEGEMPSIPEDDRAYYTFVGWMTEDGEHPDLSSVGEDLILYPDFKETVKQYDITFSVAGVDTVVSLPYGTVPEYADVPVKPEDAQYFYTFERWDKPFVPVTGDAVYTAIFSREYIIPTTDGGGSLTLEGTTYVADFTATYDRSYGISGALDRAYSGNRGLRVNVKAASVYLSVSAVKAAKEAGACEIFVEFSSSASDRYSYYVELRDSEGNILSGDHRMELSFYQPDTQASDRLKLSYSVGEELKYSNYTLENGRMVFTAASGRTYTLRREYRATLLFSGMAEASLSATVLTEGSTVYLTATVPEGVRITSTYYVDLDGNTVAITGGSFRMPATDVSVYVQTEEIKYRVTFVSEGVVMKTVYCLYGQLPEPPEDPKKPGDGAYNYTFSGWSEEIAPATEARIYTAVFEQTPVPVEPELPAEDTIYDKAFKLMLGAAAVVVLGIFIAIGACLRRR